jgi:hypothetical protein
MLGALLLLVLAAAGCGGGDDAPEQARVLVYLVRGEDVGTAARTVDAGDLERSAVEELLAGPNDEETDAGLSTAVPSGTTLAGLELADGVATVDLSGAFDDGGGSAGMFMRLAQVVFTLTQFPSVDGVRLELDGEPVDTFSAEGIVLDGPQDRADYEEQSPQILVESPAIGDVVSSPMALQGTANTFEANFEYELLDADGKKLAGTFVTATCGTGCRGTFDESVTLPDGTATLVVLERSAEDGSRINEVEIPLELG